MPDSVNLEIKTPQGRVFNNASRLYGFKSEEYPGKNMRRTETIKISLKEHPEVCDNGIIEITFSDAGKKSTFPIRI
jgi:hypothetical protein